MYSHTENHSWRYSTDINTIPCKLHKPWPTANNNISCLQTWKTFNDYVLHLGLKINVHRPCLPERWKPRSTSANVDSPQATDSPETVVNKSPTFKNWKHYKTKMSGAQTTLVYNSWELQLAREKLQPPCREAKGIPCRIPPCRNILFLNYHGEHLPWKFHFCLKKNQPQNTFFHSFVHSGNASRTSQHSSGQQGGNNEEQRQKSLPSPGSVRVGTGKL